MKKLLFIALVFVTTLCFAQELVTYLPSGEIYSGKSKTINQLNDELASGIPTYIYTTQIDDKLAIVGFELFSKNYYWMMLGSPEIRKKAIASFNLEEFFDSDKLYNEIENSIKEKKLSGWFLSYSLGEPTEKEIEFPNGKKTESWTYKGFRMKFTIVEGLVIKYTRFAN